MNITKVEEIAELTQEDKLLIISGGDIKQVGRELVSDSSMPDQVAQLRESMTDLDQKLDDVKKYGADVKKGFAEVISEKGIKTADTDSFEVMQDNVRKIPTGISNTQVLDDTLVSCIADTQVVDNTCVSCIATTKVTHEAIEE
mgnify:CR=1 FL=1